MRKLVGCFMALSLVLLVPWEVHGSGFPDKVETTIPCRDGELVINAEVEYPEGKIQSGTLKKRDFDVELLKCLYGEEKNWIETEDTEYAEGISGKEFYYHSDSLKEEDSISLSLTDNKNEDYSAMGFEIKVPEDHFEDIAAEARRDQPGEILELLEMDQNWGVEEGDDDQKTEKEMVYYRIYQKIEGVPVAIKCPLTIVGQMLYEQGYLTDLSFWCNYEIKEGEEAELLSMEEILEKVEMYGAHQVIDQVPSGDEITKIKLCYYTQKEEDCIGFRPIWVFCVPRIAEEGTVFEGLDEYFYIDAQDGKLLEIFPF